MKRSKNAFKTFPRVAGQCCTYIQHIAKYFIGHEVLRQGKKGLQLIGRALTTCLRGDK